MSVPSINPSQASQAVPAQLDARPSNLLERICRAIQKIFASIVYWITLPFQRQMRSKEFLDTLDVIIAQNPAKQSGVTIVRAGAIEKGISETAIESFKNFFNDATKQLFLCPVIVSGTLLGNHIVTIAFSKSHPAFMWFFDSKGHPLYNSDNVLKIWHGLQQTASPLGNCRYSHRSVLDPTAFQGFFDGHSCGPYVLRVFELLIDGKSPEDIYKTLPQENIEETRSRYAKMRASLPKAEPREFRVEDGGDGFANVNELP